MPLGPMKGLGGLPGSLPELLLPLEGLHAGQHTRGERSEKEGCKAIPGAPSCPPRPAHLPFAARRDTSRPVTDAEVRLEAGRAAERGWCCLGQPRLQTDTFHAREHPTLAIRLQTQTAEGSSCDMHGWGLVAH
jgi:hypothetical protein